MKFYNLFLLSILMGCSTYSSKFTCKEASGSPCEMLHIIDKKISGHKLEVKECCK